MAKDYLQLALGKFNVGIHQWYGWKDLNAPMNYSNIKLNDDTATMPTEAEVNAKIQELKDAEQNAINKKASGKQKLKDLGLDDEEIQALMGA
tara:strand:- start:2 stop:277 length:276 start_codon:yes stop_codon:yes gene_type:complete